MLLPINPPLKEYENLTESFETPLSLWVIPCLGFIITKFLSLIDMKKDKKDFSPKLVQNSFASETLADIALKLASQ